MVLDPRTVDRVLTLLTVTSLSQREIARRTGVCRGTVNAMALGRRPNADLRDTFERLTDERRRASGAPPPSRPARRCPECGAKVKLPCLACRDRRLLAQGRRRPFQTDGPDPVVLGLDLRPEHYARYLEMRPLARERYYEHQAGVADASDGTTRQP